MEAIQKQVYSWLAPYLSENGSNATPEEVEKAIKDESAMCYLMVWPIFEQKCGGKEKYITKGNIKDIAQNHLRSLELCDFESACLHFHKRYQDKENFKHLCNATRDDFSIKYKEYNDLRCKAYCDLKDIEKLTFLIFVVYRYRNNIFHGSKGIDSWSQYKEEIDLCLRFMMKIVNVAT